MRNADGTSATVEKVDAYTIRFTYKQPATLFLTALANQDGADRTYAVFLPAHYLKKFHPSYAKKEEIDKAVQAAGFKTWTELFAARNAPFENPERPTMAAWVPVTRVSDQVFTLRRNPYYIGVDPAGNQLPYIDEVRFTFFADIQALNLAAIAGELDMQERHIQMTNYPVFKEQREDREVPRHHLADVRRLGRRGRLQPVLQGRSGARRSCSRPRTSGSRSRTPSTGTRSRSRCSWGSASRARACPRRGTPTTRATSGRRSTPQYKPDEANKLLDGLGLTRKDAQGIRLLPNGKPATIELSVVPAFAAWPDVAQLIAKDWEKVGVKAVVQIRERALHFKMRDANELQDGDLERGHHARSRSPATPRSTCATPRS